MKRFWPILSLILLCALILQSKFLFFPSPKAEGDKGKSTKESAGKDPKSMGKPMRVKTLVIAPDTLRRTLFATGTAKAWDLVDLYAEASGRITQISFQEGKSVQKGQILVQLQNSDLRAQARKIQVQLDLAQKKLARTQKLFQGQGSSQEELENAKASVEQLLADQELIQAQIAKTQTKAPFAGIIGLRNISLGTMVNPQTKLLTLQNTQKLKIDFNVPEDLSGQFSTGQTINVEFDKNFVKKGKIIALEPNLDSNSRTRLLRAELASDPNILPGSFARIITPSSKKNSILIPTEALTADLKGTKVWLQKGGKAVEQRVATGMRTEAKVEITSGLQQGDSLIISHLMSLRPGQDIIPLDPNSTPKTKAN